MTKIKKLMLCGAIAFTTGAIAYNAYEEVRLNSLRIGDYEVVEFYEDACLSIYNTYTLEDALKIAEAKQDEYKERNKINDGKYSITIRNGELAD